MRRFTTILWLDAGAEGVTVWLEPDPAGRAPALGRAHGHRLYYEGQVDDPEVRERVTALGRAWSARPDAPLPSADAVGTLMKAADRAGPGRLIELKRLPPRQPVPRWGSRLRLGDPPREGRGIWPFDAELAGLEADVRRLLKREPHSLAELEAERAWLSGRGLALRLVEPDDRPPVLFAAHDRDVVERAASNELLIAGEGEASAEAARWLGDALGYPACCVDRSTKLQGHDDLSLAVALLPPAGSPPASPLNSWFLGALSPTSHAHCSLSCAPSARLADATVDALDAWRPGFRERLLHLATRVHAVDVSGRAWALQVEGDLAAGDATIGEALELVPDPDGPTSLVLRTERALEGAAAVVEDGWLRAGAGSDALTAALVADHRGA